MCNCETLTKRIKVLEREMKETNEKIEWLTDIFLKFFPADNEKIVEFEPDFDIGD